MDALEALLLVALVGSVVWNSIHKSVVLWELSKRAFATGTVRGFWGNFFRYCGGGRYSFLVSLALALPIFLLLLVAVPLIRRRTA